MKQALAIKAFALLLAAQPSLTSAAALGSAELSACSCDCCEVERRREDVQETSESESDRFQCALTQLDATYNSPFHAKAPRCSNLCRQDPRDSVLTSTEVPEMDTQRFCFFECEPDAAARASEGAAAPQPGDLCRPLSRDEVKDVQDSSGNARPPMESPRMMVHFLARRQRKSGAAIAAAASGRSTASSGTAVGSSATGNMGNSAAVSGAPPVSPWQSIAEPAQEASTMAVKLTEQANQSATEAIQEAEKVQALQTTVGSSLSSALASVEKAKESALVAQKAAEHIHDITVAVRKEARKEAFKEIPEALAELKKKAQKKADEAAKKRKDAMTKELKVEGDKAKLDAMKPFEEAQKRASAAANTYAKRADALVSASASLQVQATLEQGSANQEIAVGNMNKAQQYMQMSRQNMNLALSMNGQASSMYDTANNIVKTLPAYSAQAAAASYHAESMYNPDVMPPPPPLVLAQQGSRQRRLEGRV